MIAPDEYVIRLLDQAVLWFHNWGIARKWLVRASSTALALGGGACALMRHPGDYFMPMIMVVIVVGLGAFHEWAEGLGNKQITNIRKLATRASIIGWMRFSVIILDAWTVFQPWGFDGIFWMFWLWLPLTLLPPDPPKRKWQEELKKLFEPKGVVVPT